MKTQTKEQVTRWRNAHHSALLSLYRGSKETTGLALWQKLHRLESYVHSATCAYCNGESITIHWPKFGSYLPLPETYDFRTDENAWERLKTVIKDCLRNIFGEIPEGVYVNGDARGHALKLDSEKVSIPEGMQTDLGHDGILAAEIS